MSNFLGYRDGGKTNEQGLFQWLGKMFTKGTPSIDNTASMQVVQRGAGANMSVDVSIGDVSIADTSYNYYGWSDAVNNKTISTADATNPRRDIVVAYVDKSVVSSSSNNNPNALNFAVVAGTPAGSPADPSGATIQAAVGAGNPYVQLARVAVAASASSIVNANITDLRAAIAFKGKLWGGSTNTVGHTVPNVADDTVALLNATQTFTNKSFAAGSLPLSSVAGAPALVYDFVESGCVWSGDSYGSTLNGSMTSGFAWIGGVRVTVAAVTAHAFTLSKDTYVYVDNTGAITYSPQTNNSASPSLPANSLLLGIIISGASSIAAATSVNQGQETMVLPIASSIPYAVTDSLGNLICPRDPNRKILGYREVLANQTGFSAATLITGLSVPANVPANRKILITSQVGFDTSVNDTASSWSIKESATYLDTKPVGAATGYKTATLIKLTSPTTGLHTYTVEGQRNSGTGTISPTSTGGAGTPGTSFIRVQLF